MSCHHLVSLAAPRELRSGADAGWMGRLVEVRKRDGFLCRELLNCIPPPLVCLLVACKLKLVKAI